MKLLNLFLFLSSLHLALAIPTRTAPVAVVPHNRTSIFDLRGVHSPRHADVPLVAPMTNAQRLARGLPPRAPRALRRTANRASSNGMSWLAVLNDALLIRPRSPARDPLADRAHAHPRRDLSFRRAARLRLARAELRRVRHHVRPRAGAQRAARRARGRRAHQRAHARRGRGRGRGHGHALPRARRGPRGRGRRGPRARLAELLLRRRDRSECVVRSVPSERNRLTLARTAAPGAPPAPGANTFSAWSGAPAAAEAGVWAFDARTGALAPRWVNADGCKSRVGEHVKSSAG
jgi:hypothetical protein